MLHLQGKTTLGTKKLVFKEGEPATKMYMVRSGSVICLKQAGDRLVPVFTAGEDDIIGESAMIKNGVYAYSAITLSPSELVDIPASNFTTVFREAPEWLVELTTTMIKRFQHTANLVTENRIIHPSLVNEANFTDAAEVEYKKILSKTV